MKHNYHKLHSQKGLSLIVLILILIITGSAIYISQLNANNIRAMRSQTTANALIEAKKALLGYAVTIDLQGACTSTCARPGDLPCPDTDNNGEAETWCGNATGTTGQAVRLGRLPWKTLGLADLRDGNGDRLWYAVSNNFKNNTKTLPLNNDTLGTINMTDFNGLVSANGTSGAGVIAVIFSPGEPLTRQDGTQQVRSSANENSSVHYLDNALGEDNADFADSSSNGFVSGPIRNAAGDVILNDQLMAISRKDMFTAIDGKVLKEVKAALATFYNTYHYYPTPAEFDNEDCLGTSNATLCTSELLVYEGRLPATTIPSWGIASILRAESNNNWFQQNGWREQVYYAVSPACTLTLPVFLNCAGIGSALTLNGAINGATSKNMILLMSGPPLAGQSRNTIVHKKSRLNYYELENASTLDYEYQRDFPYTATFNDAVESVP